MGSLEAANFFLSYTATQNFNMMLTLSLPTLAVRDLRPGVPREASLVLSTADIGAEQAGAGVMLPGAPPPPGSAGCAKGGAGGGGGGGVGDDGLPHAQGANLLPSLMTLEYR